MKYKTTQIKKVDLNKLLKLKGYSVYKLSKLSRVDYSNLKKARNGVITLSEASWNKIKFFIK